MVVQRNAWLDLLGEGLIFLISPRTLMSSTRFRLRWISLAAVFSLSLIAIDARVSSSDGKKPKKTPDQTAPFTFKVPVDVVVVNAMVTDKKGSPVKDLTINEFKVYEDGKPQPIHTFSLETYRPVQEPVEGTAKKQSPGEPAQAETATTPRYFSLVIDDLNSPAMEQFYRALEAMKKFVTNQMLPGDLVMIYAVSGRAEFPFTSNQEALLQYLSELYKKLNLSRTTKADCPQLTDLQAYRLANSVADMDSLDVAIIEYCSCMDCTNLSRDTIEQMVLAEARKQYYEEMHFRQVALSSLRQHVRSLRHFEGRKSVILFSPGFIAEDVRYEIQEVVDRALRAGVVFNAVDARGLYTVGFDASERVNTASNPMVLARKISALQEARMSQADPLSQLAAETGGYFHHNNNDLYAGMKVIAERQTYYYVLTYASPDIRNDGRYHKIKLEVSRPGIEVTYRKGYYAPKEEISFETRKKEDILEAMQAPGNLNKIPVQFSYSFYQLDENRYQLVLLIQVDVRGIKFLNEEARHRNLMNLVVAAYDEKDHYIDGLDKQIEFSLTNDGYANLVNYGMTSKVEIAVPPGRYKIKAVVREGVQTKMGSLTKVLEVP
jgi:VWFA-related protein